MARTNNLSNFLTDVAGAIKEKKGSETPIQAANFDTEIRNLPSQGTYQQKTVPITQNGTQTVTPDSGYDAIDELTLNVAVADKRLQTKSYTFQQNGSNIPLTPDSGYDGFDQVNLTIDVSGGAVNNQDKTITENGIYTADQGYTGIGTATVNVPQPQNLGITLPDSVTIDKFVSMTNIPLFTIPKSFDGKIIVTGYGKYNSEDSWVRNNGFTGDFAIIEGSVTDAVTYSFSNLSCKYLKFEVAIIKDGYYTISQDIPVTLTPHAYGLVNLCIQQTDVMNIKDNVTIVCINQEDPNIQPVSVTLSPNDYWPTWKCFLPQGTWDFYFRYGSIYEHLTQYYIGNDDETYAYAYITLPGFTVNIENSRIDIDGSSYYQCTVSGTVTVYDDEDAVLYTYSIPYTYYHSINYTYVGEYDHYIVSLTCWEAEDTVTDTYTSSTIINPSFSAQNNKYFGTITFREDGNDITTTQALTNLIQNSSMTFTEVDSYGEFIKNMDYLVVYDTSYNTPRVVTRFSTSNYGHIETSSAQYETFLLTLAQQYVYSYVADVSHRVPVVTFNVALQDIDGNPIPYNDDTLLYTNMNSSNNNYNMQNVNGYIVFQIPAKVNTINHSEGNVTCWLSTDSQGNCPIKYLLMTGTDLAGYSVDTTINTSVRLPVTLTNDYCVVVLGAYTVEGIQLNNRMGEIWTSIENVSTSDQYTMVNMSTYNNLDSTSSCSYAVKVASNTNIAFTGGDLTINGTNYHTVSTNAGFANEHEYVTFSWSSIFIENTSIVAPVNVYLYRGAPSVDYNHEGMYKIEMYRNGILAESNSTFSGNYTCNVSLFVNDTVEFRIYKNENTVNDPIWSSRYMTLMNTTVANAYERLYFSEDIYLEEVDAYIDQETYVNKHVYTLQVSNAISGTVEHVTQNTLIAHIIPVNYSLVDIFSYIGGVDVSISDSNTGTQLSYLLSYNTSTNDLIYIDSTELPIGTYNIYVTMSDTYGGVAQTNFTINVIGTAFPVLNTIPYTQSDGTVIEALSASYSGGISDFTNILVDFTNTTGVTTWPVSSTPQDVDIELYIDGALQNTISAQGVAYTDNGQKLLEIGDAAITLDMRQVDEIEIQLVNY